MNDLLTSTLSRLRQALESGTLTNDQLHDEFWKSREIAIRGGVQISSALSRLSDSQRVALMCVSENEYTRLDDPYVLDEVDARDSLFDFIEQPSEEVLIAHEIHLRRCGRGGAGAA